VAEEFSADNAYHDDSGIITKRPTEARQEQSGFGILAGLWSVATAVTTSAIPHQSKTDEVLRDMRKRARDVFMKFLSQLDVAKDEFLSKPPEAMQDARLKSKLLTQIIGYYEAVSRELASDEIALWDAFAHEDINMTGTIDMRGPALPAVIRCLPISEDVDPYVDSIRHSLAPDNVATFVDIVDWWTEERKSRGHNSWHTLQRSLRLFSLLPGAGQSKSRLREIVEKYAWQMDIMQLSAAAHSSQRTLVDTSAWRCQQQLTDAWTNADAMDTDLLLNILTLVQDLLSPAERFVWAAFAPYDADLDGVFSESEVLAAIESILSVAEERECVCEGSTDRIDESIDRTELREFRAQALQEAVSKLFSQSGTRCKDSSVSCHDVLKWWWDLSEDYRAALGLVVTRPASGLQPAVIFSQGLARMTRGRGAQAALRKALCGQSRLLAELRVTSMRKILAKNKF